MQFVKTLAFDIPIFLTEKANRIKAPQEAKRDNSKIGINELKVKIVSVRFLSSKIRNMGRNRIAPIIF